MLAGRLSIADQPSTANLRPIHATPARASHQDLAQTRDQIAAAQTHNALGDAGSLQGATTVAEVPDTDILSFTSTSSPSMPQAFAEASQQLQIKMLQAIRKGPAMTRKDVEDLTAVLEEFAKTGSTSEAR